MKFGKALTLLSILILTGCGTQTDSGATDSFCLVSKPIYWSKDDTAGTINAVKEHNAIGVKLCGWK